MSDLDQPAWLTHAWSHFGTSEAPGAADNPDVVAFYRDAGHPQITRDSVAWCAAFVGACLQRAGVPATRSLLARSYLTWGEALDAPRRGAVAIFSRGSDPGAGHVGFVVAATVDRILLLGGNQSDRVSVDSFPRDRLLALRWPRAPTVASDATDTLFDRCLTHVLAMEGGYTDDPHDPGGPTNLGITLATLAAWRGIEVTPETFGPLKSAIRDLDAATARAIYAARYWQPSGAPDLPPALALMHFDASVNHGVGGAIRMLQTVLGVEVDGEVGPLTLAAARTRPTAQTLAAYADTRIQRYRALPHFWRFGRGWLARVARTRTAAAALVSLPQGSTMTTETTTTTETTAPPPTEAPPKWWGHSMTLWGTFITAVSTVLPVIGPLFGIDITAGMIRDLGAGITTFVQAAGGLIGTALAIYGRIRAATPLTRKTVAVTL